MHNNKSLLTGLAVLFIVPLFSLVLVSAANAYVRGDACTTSNDCNAGLSCVANPWLGNTAGSAPAPFNETDPRVCCDTVWGCIGQEGVQEAIGLGDEDPRDIAASVVNIILGFLGIIAVVLILAGGFMWMTAAGNDDKVISARNLMVAGAVGLVIILAAFGVSQFVVNRLLESTGAVVVL